MIKERRWNVAHVIAVILTFIFGTLLWGLRVVSEGSMTLQRVEDQVGQNTSMNHVMIKELKGMDKRIESEDSRVSHIEGKLGIQDGE